MRKSYHILLNEQFVYIQGVQKIEDTDLKVDNTSQNNKKNFI